MNHLYAQKPIPNATKTSLESKKTDRFDLLEALSYLIVLLTNKIRTISFETDSYAVLIRKRSRYLMLRSFFIALFFMGFGLGKGLADCTVSTSTTFSAFFTANPGCTSKLIIPNGVVLTLSGDFTVPSSINQIVVQNGGQINWGGNFTLALATNTSIVIANTSTITGIQALAATQSCNNNKRIRIGTVEYAACVGGGNVCIIFDDLIKAGGTLSPVSTLDVSGGVNGNVCFGPFQLNVSVSGFSLGTPTYSWAKTSGPGTASFSASSTTQNPIVTVTTPGTYVFTVTVTDPGNADCPTITTVTNAITIVVRPITAATISATGSPVCLNGTSPVIKFTNPNGFAETITYNIGGGSNQTVDVAANSFTDVNAPTGSSGTFIYNLVSAVYTDASPVCNSSITGSASVTINPIPMVSGPNSVCPGATIQLIGSIPGGTWSGGSGTTASINTSTGVVTGIVDGTNANFIYTATGCPSIAYNVTVNNSLTPPVSGGDQSVCATTPVQTLTATATGSGITWWDAPTEGNAVANPTLNSIGTVTYYAQASNGACISPTRTAVTLTIRSTPTISIANQTDVSCFGGANGAVTFTTGGGTGGIIVTPAQITGLSAGLHTFTATDATGCFTTIDVTIKQPSTALTATATKTDALCFGAATGTATAVPLGGTAPYTYLWNDPGAQTGITATALAAGTYMVTVTDANGCTTTASATVGQPIAALTATATKTDALCFGAATGTATAVPLGGTAPYTYLWNDPSAQTGITATALATGTYMVTVTDANGCTTTASATVGQPTTALTATATKTNILCFGATTGTSTAVPLGGTAPYTYLWNDPGAQTGITATALAAGTYMVTVTDANGCTTTASATVGQPIAALTATATKTDALCFGAASGTATAVPLGGTAPYTYLWNDPSAQTGITATALAAGTYMVTVTDANGCTTTASATVGQPIAALTATATKTDALCFGAATGTATAVPLGGTAPYTYLWNDPGAQTGITATALAAGTYMVTVTDANGCTTTASATVGQPIAALTATATKTDILCFGAATGTATAVPLDGTAPYTYLWNDPGAQTGITATALAAGTYMVTVTDAKGCTTTASATVGQPIAALTATATKTDALCFGAATGTATAVPLGGTAPYTYLWNDSGAQTGITATALVAGTYMVTVTDAKGCTTTASATVGQPIAALTATATKTDALCFGAATGTATAVPLGGTAPYTYLWNDPLAQTGITATALAAGTYMVTVTDAKGCTTTASATLGQPATALTATATKTDILCFGAATGTATAVPLGGTAPYTYLWNDPSAQTGITATALAAGTYMVTVTDANGCTTTASATVGQPIAALTATATKTDILCFGAATGTATAVPLGGTAPYTYLWNDPSAQTGITATALAAGTYMVTVTDANGCTTTASATVGQPIAALTATATKTDALCFGTATGTATAVPLGGTAPYTYLWNDPGAQTGITATALAIGTYMVTVTDANGCTTTASATVGQPAPLTETPITGPTEVCAGNTITLANATPGGTWSVNNPNAIIDATTGELTGVLPGAVIVTYTVITAQNCTFSVTYNVTVKMAELIAKDDTEKHHAATASNVWFIDPNCMIICKVVYASYPVQGTTNTFVRFNRPSGNPANIDFLYATRHYQVTPMKAGENPEINTDAATMQGTVTLYFTQADFTLYNGLTTRTDIPANPADNVAKANVRIHKFPGVSSNQTSMLPASYTGPYTEIVPSSVNWVVSPLEPEGGRWEVVVPVTGFSGLFLTSPLNNPLPVTLISFSGKKTGKTEAKLNWATSEEKDFREFQIQKSSDSKTFEMIGKVAARSLKDASLNYYEFLDPAAVLSNNYYRLKMVDNDGTFEYSKIIHLEGPVFETDIIGLPYPNPNSEKYVVLDVLSTQAGVATINVRSVSGLILTRSQLPVSIGMSKLSINTSALPGGIFLFEVIVNSKSYSRKVVIIK